MGQGMARLERGNDALQAAQLVESLQSGCVLNREVPGAARVLQVAVLGADARIVQARRDTVSVGDLALLVLQDVAARAMEDAWFARDQGSGVIAQPQAAARGLDADQLDGWVLHESVGHAN